ncbi:MAG TPA: MbnP family copper-binding protein [Patescibacteria group bacterium]|nr:MbnP family copper-binding protein [Patescibacteria group bacterium]
MSRAGIFGLLTILISLAAGGAASQEAGTGLKPQPVHVRFEGRLAGKPFACGKLYEGVGTGATTVTPADLRFFVSNIELIDAQGGATPVALDQDGVWQYKSLALIDLEDGTGECRNGNTPMHAEATGSAPPREYKGVRFTVGVPFDLDHVDPLQAPSPLNMTAMLWTWQSGYKFIRAEVVVAPSGASATAAATPAEPGARAQNAAVEAHSRGFPVHIGSTGCGGTVRTAAPPQECMNPNRIVVTLEEFDAAKDVVIFDFGRLLANSDVTVNSPSTAPGCMSGEDDPDCAPVMGALGLPFRGSPVIAQTVFYRARK